MVRYQPLVAMSSLRPLLGFLAAAVGTSAAENSPVRIEQTVEPQFPTALAFSPVSAGEARIVIIVDATGKLADMLVSGYTHQAFADEAVRALKQWRYSPAYERGEPIGIRMELKFDFTATGRVVSLTPMDAVDAFTHSWLPPTFVTRICSPRELDRPMMPLRTVDPGNPGKSPASNETGTVLVDFYVDEKGQTRMPVVLNTTHETYAQAAVWALSQWRFAAPTRRGEPVAVRVRQQFVFPGS
jgi:protein TonB